MALTPTHPSRNWRAFPLHGGVALCLGVAIQPHRHGCGITAKPKRLRDADGSPIGFERAILREQPCGDGALRKVRDRAPAKTAAAVAGMGNNREMGDHVTPDLVTCHRDEPPAGEYTGGWAIDGAATVIPLGRVARLLQRIQRAASPGPIAHAWGVGCAECAG